MEGRRPAYRKSNIGSQEGELMQENDKRGSRREGERNNQEKNRNWRGLDMWKNLHISTQPSVYDLHLHRIGYCCTGGDH